MNHLIMLPLLLPLLMGSIIILSADRGIRAQRALGLAGALLVLAGSVALFAQAFDGQVQMYVLGDWQPPFGIVMVLDRLSAMMVLITSVLAVLCLLYAMRGTDERGKNFHALFQFQLLGINGAFLTGDIFNLFVFFEIMLLSSYGLVLHGGGPARVRAGLHYVALNLIGSSVFLIGVGILYGILGSLNMADLAVRLSGTEQAQSAILQASALILFGVFALKAALLPLYFWLPNAYGFTSAPVAALFAIMTKVGVYVILRVYTLIFGDHAGVAANVVEPWLLPLALVTLAAGAIGVAACRDLRRMLAYLVVVSVGTLLAVIGTFETRAIAAALVYLPHTTFVTAAMFLIADMIRRQRPLAGAALQSDWPVAQFRLLGLLYFGGAVAIVGLPPLSGFTAKVMMLGAVQGNPSAPGIWALVLIAGLMALTALGRAGSMLFWKVRAGADTNERPGVPCLGAADSIPALALLGISPLLVIFGGPLSEFALATAEQLMNPAEYVAAVMGTEAAAQIDAVTGGR